MGCVNNVKVDTSVCLKPCSGLIVTSLSKSGHHGHEKKEKFEKFESLFPSFEEYNIYKTITLYPFGSSGKLSLLPLLFLIP